MIKDQLKKLKQNAKTYEIAPTIPLTFADTQDISTSILFNLITTQTEYTTRKYFSFNRFNLTQQQENIFNCDFSRFVKSLVQFKNNDDFAYLLDLLNRVFYLERYNREEFFFSILPMTIFKEQTIYLSKNLNFLDNFEYSYKYFAVNCYKNIYFFDFILEYFKYYIFCSDFLENIFMEMSKLGANENVLANVIEFIDFFVENDNYEILCKTFFIFKKKYDFGDNFDELEKKLELINKENNRENKKKIIIIDNKETKFENLSKIFDYKENEFEKSSIILDNKYENNNTHSDIFKIYISNQNFEFKYSIFEILSREFVKQNFKEILQQLINYKNIYFYDFLDFITESILFDLNLENNFAIENFIEIAKTKNYKIKNFIFEKEILNLKFSNYILEFENDFTLIEINFIFKKIKELNNLHLFAIFITSVYNKIKIEKISFDDIKEIFYFYIENKIQMEIILNIIQIYLHKNFDIEILKFFIDNSEADRKYIEIYKFLYLIDKNYFNDKNDLIDILKESCLISEIYFEIKKYNKNEIENIIENFDKIKKDVEKSKHLYLKNYKENVKTFVWYCLQLIKNEFYEEKCISIILENEDFYLGLFDFVNEKLAKIIFIEGLEEHFSSKITKIIFDSSDTFYNDFFDIFEEIQNKIGKIDIKIEDYLKTSNIEKKSAFINFLVKNEYDLFNFIDEIIIYCDEFSLINLIKKYGNFMVPYLDFIFDKCLNGDISYLRMNQNSFFNIDLFEVCKIICKNIYSREYNDINENVLLVLFNYLSFCFNNIEKKNIKNVIKFFSLKKIDHKEILKYYFKFLAKFKFENEYVSNFTKLMPLEDIYFLFEDILPECNRYFHFYIDGCLQTIFDNNLNFTKCIINYFSNEKENNSDKETCKKVVLHLIQNNDDQRQIVYALLNYINEIEFLNNLNKIYLDDIKEKNNFENFKLLIGLYKNVKLYKNCILNSMPYFTLFIDDKNKEIKRGMKNLIEKIEEFTKENIYNYL